jgi:hypothetical protein
MDQLRVEDIIAWVDKYGRIVYHVSPEEGAGKGTSEDERTSQCPSEA